jgi:aquaporin Z
MRDQVQQLCNFGLKGMGLLAHADSVLWVHNRGKNQPLSRAGVRIIKIPLPQGPRNLRTIVHFSALTAGLAQGYNCATFRHSAGSARRARAQRRACFRRFSMHSSVQKWSAEFLGTLWLTLGGCGAGGHFNPAVSVGLSMGGRFAWSELPGYVVSQVLGAITGAAILYVIATGKAGADIGGFATNGYGTHSPGGYGLTAALVTEVVMTAFFIIVILGATARRAAAGFGGLAIGLCLTLIHLISIPVTNTSVNPARSTGPALFGPEIAISQLWLFWVAPIVGALIGAVIYKALLAGPADE